MSYQHIDKECSREGWIIEFTLRLFIANAYCSVRFLGSKNYMNGRNFGLDSRFHLSRSDCRNNCESLVCLWAFLHLRKLEFSWQNQGTNFAMTNFHFLCCICIENFKAVKFCTWSVHKTGQHSLSKDSISSFQDLS